MKEENHTQYQETSDFRKLLKISKEYTERYSKELGEYWKDDNYNSIEFSQNFRNLMEAKPTNALMSTLKQRLETVLGSPSQMSLCTAPYSHKRKLSHFAQEEGDQDRINDSNIEKYSKDIVILDYLMTARQLLDILRENPNDHEKFARKSRI